jgi:maleate isomerase
MSYQDKTHLRGPTTITGALSGKKITIPDVNAPPMPALSTPGLIEIDSDQGYPDVRSYQRKFGLLIPATNTSMEHELWSIIFKNQGVNELAGVGLHTSNVATPSPKLASADDLIAYQQQFLSGLKIAVDSALLSQPHYLIMGMSLEHIIYGLDKIKAPMAEIEAYSGLSWSTWHEAAPAALNKFGAKRIGLISPFDNQGNKNATRLFEDLGFEVVASVGFSCAHAMHIAHIPDWAKEKAVMELLATKENKLDAIVQCGTNMSFINVAEKLEPILNIPLLGINAVTFWYALREIGFASKLTGGGNVFRQF